MSSRERVMLETPSSLQADEVAPPPGTSTAPQEPVAAGDPGARRLQALAERIASANPAIDYPTLDTPDAEFGPLSLTQVVALGKLPSLDDGPAAAIGADPRADGPSPADPSPGPPPLPTGHMAPTAPLAALLSLATESRENDSPSQGRLITLPASADRASDFVLEDLSPLLDEPAATDLRLVDLIRHHEALIQKLGTPPADPARTAAAGTEPDNAGLALPFIHNASGPIKLESTPAPDPEPEPSDHAGTPAASNAIAVAAPAERATRPSYPLAAALASEQTASPPPEERALPSGSPMIIQRARAEQSGRQQGLAAAAAPPSAIPAFVAGLALAFVIASVLFVTL